MRSRQGVILQEEATSMKFLSGRLRWVLISLIFVISAIAYMTRVNMSVAGQSLMNEYHWNNVQLGYVLSAFILGYGLFQAPGGRLADRFGPRIVIPIGVLIWCIGTSLTAFVPANLPITLLIMVVVQSLVGVGQAVVFPASNRLVAAWIPTAERGIANGFIFSGVGFGSAITPPLITFVLVDLGWKWSFQICALIGLVIIFLWWFLARDTPEKHPSISQKELRLIEAGLPAKTAQKPLPWATIVKDKQVILLSLSYFTFGYAVYIFFTWFFIYLNKVRGLDLKSSSYYAMLPFLAMMVGSPAGGWVADRVVKRYGKRIGRCGLGLVALSGGAVFIAFATQIASVGISTVFLSLGAGSIYFGMSSYWAVTADIAGASAGSVSGLMNMLAQIGGASASILTPLIGDHAGWTPSFLVAAGLCVFGAIAWLFINPNARLLSK